jgi:cytochrome c
VQTQLRIVSVLQTLRHRRPWSMPRRHLAAWGVVLATLMGSGCFVVGDGDAAQESEAELGKRLARGYDCGGCHVIPGVAAAIGTVGPPLSDWSERGYIAGALRNTPENLAAFLIAPQQYEPDGGMPNIGVRPEDARLISIYLFTLGRGLTAPAGQAGRAPASAGR